MSPTVIGRPQAPSLKIGKFSHICFELMGMYEYIETRLRELFQGTKLLLTGIRTHNLLTRTLFLLNFLLLPAVTVCQDKR